MIETQKRSAVQTFNDHVERFDKLTNGVFDRVTDVTMIHRHISHFIGNYSADLFEQAAREAGYEISVKPQNVNDR